MSGVAPETPEVPATHSIVVVSAQKLDAPGLVRAVCTCGKYRSGVYGSEAGARRAGDQHVKAKTQS